VGSSRRRSWLEIVSDVAAFLSLNAGYITNKMRKKLQVYAVLRVDEDIAGDEAIMVKEILPTLEEAVQEVARLNQLHEGKRCHYLWRLGRYFPEGSEKTSEASSSDSD